MNDDDKTPPEAFNVCLPRSKEAYQLAIASLQVETNPIYHPGEHLTWCNRFVNNVTALMDCEIPFMLANSQCDWLNTISGRMAGWYECSESKACARAEAGYPTVAVWRNPADPPVNHGHIAMVVPAVGGVGCHIAQAGAHNFSCAPLAKGFGSYQPQWFSHD